MLHSCIQATDTQKIKPIIDMEFSFEEANKAIEYMKQGRHFGKVIIKVT